MALLCTRKTGDKLCDTTWNNFAASTIRRKHFRRLPVICFAEQPARYQVIFLLGHGEMHIWYEFQPASSFAFDAVTLQNRRPVTSQAYRLRIFFRFPLFGENASSDRPQLFLLGS